MSNFRLFSLFLLRECVLAAIQQGRRQFATAPWRKEEECEVGVGGDTGGNGARVTRGDGAGEGTGEYNFDLGGKGGGRFWWLNFLSPAFVVTLC